MSRFHFLLLLLLGLCPVDSGKAAEDAPLQNPALKRFNAELQMLVRKYYPKATSHVLGDKIHFEHDTRIFLVHEATKTGVWQDPWEERGPKLGGIHCDITLEKGPYQGAAVMPFTFDKRYFKVLGLTPYAAKQDVHLAVRLAYPRDVNPEFLHQFTALMNDFAKYLD